MKIEHLFFITLAILMGVIIPYQSQLNARLGNVLGSPYLGTLCNFVVGLFVISTLIIVTKVKIPNFETIYSVHPIYYLGGAMGVLFVTVSLLLVPRIGAINLFSCLIFGQIISSIIMDYLGLFSEFSKEISRDKWIGILLLLAGIFFILKEK